MSIRKLKKGWQIDYYADGRRTRELVFGSRKDAELALSKRKIQIKECKFFNIQKIKKVKLKDFSRTLIFLRKSGHNGERMVS